jgi:hypothetical protein
LAKKKRHKISRMAARVATEERGKGSRTPIEPAKKQIQNDVSRLPQAYKVHAAFILRSLRAGLSAEEIRAKLDRVVAGAEDAELAVVVLGTIARSKRHK